MDPNGETATLHVVATPLGNLQDLSPRAQEVLRLSEFWLVEDSRVSAHLATYLGVKKPMRRLDEHTTEANLKKYVQEIAGASSVALLTDAGTPGISDPGAQLIDLCYQTGITIDAAPGPSAVTCALSVSGFFAQRFVFLGYLSRKEGDVRRELEPYRDSPLTIVVFESPYRIDKILPVICEVLGNRRYAICRELTKKHQQVTKGELPEMPSIDKMPRKGEFTIVIEGRRKSRHAP